MTSIFLAPLALAASAVVAPPAARAPDPGAAVRVVAAATPYWAPPEGARKKRKARPQAVEVHRAEAQARAESTATLEEEVFGDDGDTRSAGTVRRNGRAGDDEDGRLSAMAVIGPHLLSFGLGVAMVGRSFGFNTQLQGEHTFPRAGMVATLESFPLTFLGGVASRFGIAGSFEREIGSATAGQPDGGSLGYPVSEGRWSVDVRYAFVVSERFLLVPLVGFGHSSYDIRRRTETTAPSMCNGMATQVCFPDVAVSHMTVGLSSRFALTPSWGLSVGAAVLPGFGVGRARGQLGVEGAPSALGFAADVGLGWQLLDWLTVNASLPVTRYAYSWTGATLPYRSASETYYSLVFGATVFTK